MFGTSDADVLQSSWSMGRSQVDQLSPAAVNYVAGYCSKKIGWKAERGERVDPETGEVY